MELSSSELRLLSTFSFSPSRIVGACPTVFVKNTKGNADLEKAASGASGDCEHFVGNHAILRTF